MRTDATPSSGTRFVPDGKRPRRWPDAHAGARRCWSEAYSES
jgi:hypothetical protein